MSYLTTLEILRKLWKTRCPHRLMYLRTYPNNTRWHGFLSDMAICELEFAGNTVQRRGGHYILNSTEPVDLITARLIAIVQDDPQGAIL